MVPISGNASFHDIRHAIQELDETAGSKGVLQFAQSLGAGDRLLLEKLLLVLSGINRTEDALTCFKAYQSANPTMTDLSIQLLWNQIHHQSQDSVLAFLKDEYQKGNMSRSWQGMYARVLAGHGDFSEAERIVADIEKETGNSAEYGLLGISNYLQTGDIDYLKGMLKKSIRLDYGNSRHHVFKLLNQFPDSKDNVFQNLDSELSEFTITEQYTWKCFIGCFLMHENRHQLGEALLLSAKTDININIYWFPYISLAMASAIDKDAALNFFDRLVSPCDYNNRIVIGLLWEYPDLVMPAGQLREFIANGGSYRSISSIE